MRFKVICALLALVMSSCCMVYVVNYDDTPDVLVVPPDSELISTLAQRPDSGTPADFDARQNLYISAGELQRSGSFSACATGATTSMGIEQKVSALRTVVGDSVFKQSASFSSLVKFGQQRFVSDGNYLLRNHSSISSLDNIEWQNTASKITEQSFKDMFGYIPTGLTGYVLNDNTILDAQEVSEEDGLYTFRYTLDTTVAPYFVLYEMRTSAGTKGFPTFQEANLIVTMDDNWQVKTVTTDCRYKVAMLGGLECKESLTETFYDIGSVKQLPYYDFFQQYFDAETVEPDLQPDAFSLLSEMFSTYLTENKPLDVAVDISGKDISLKGNARALINADDLENITVVASLGGFDLMYCDKTLLLQKDDFKASATVDGIARLISTLIPDADISLPDMSSLEQLAGNISVVTEEDKATLSLPLNIGDLTADVAVTGILSGDGYLFDSATVNLGEVNITLRPDSWQVPEFDGDYPDITAVADMFEQGKVAFSAQVGETEVGLMADIVKKRVEVKALGATAVLDDDGLKFRYKDLSLQLTPNRYAEAADIFTRIFGVSDADFSIERLLGGLNVSFGEQSLSVGIGDTTAILRLEVKDNGWNIKSINVYTPAGEITVSPVRPWTETETDGEFADAMPLLRLVKKYLFSDSADLLLSVSARSLQIQGRLNVRYGDGAFSAVFANDDLSVMWRDGLKIQTGNFRASVSAEELSSLFSLTGATENAFNGEINISCRYAEGALLIELSSGDFVAAVSVTDDGNIKQARLVYKGIEVCATECGKWEVPSFYGDFPQIKVADALREGKLAFALTSPVQAYVAVDILKGYARMEWEDLDVVYENNTVFIKYGNVKAQLAVEDLPEIAEILQPLIDLPELPSPEPSVTFTEGTEGRFTIALSDLLKIHLKNIENVWTLEEISLSISDVTFSATVAGWRDKQTDFDGAVNIADVARQFAPMLAKLVNADGYLLNADLTVSVKGATYVARFDVLYSNGLQVNVALSDADGRCLIEGNVKLLGGKLYVDVGGIRTALNLNDVSSDLSLQQLTDSLYGINDDLDAILDVIEKFATSEIDFASLFKNVAFEDGVLYVTADGSQWGLSVFECGISASDDALNVRLSDIAAGTISLSANASVSESTQKVSVDGDSYVTDLVAEIDSVNSLYVQLDLLNGMIRFRMGNDNVLYGQYDVGASLFRLNYDTVYAQGDISEIEDVIKRLGALLGYSDPVGNAFSLSVADILRSVQLQTADGGTELGVRLGNIGVTLTFTTGQNACFDKATVSVAGKDVTVSLSEGQRYLNFDGSMPYVDIGLVFDDFFPVLEQLFVSRSWTFALEGELQLADGSRYRLAEGTVARFDASQDYAFDATLIIEKFNGSVYESYKTVAFTYANERFFIDFNGLKITFSLQSVKDTLALKDKLFEVVPQLKQLVDDLLSAKNQASKPVDISTVLLNLGYIDGVFDVVVNGGVFMSGLGEVSLSLSAKPDFTLTVNSLHYDGMTLNGSCSVKAEQTEIVAPDISQYINFDSMYHLLSAFTVTADRNSFHIEGKITAKLVVTVDLFVAVYVDIDQQGFVNVAVLLQREKLGIFDFSGAAFNDYGGYSYLYYNGGLDTITVIRNSWNCSWGRYTMKEKDYSATYPARQFTGTVLIDNLLEMVNFKHWIENLIRDKTSTGNGSYQAEQLLTGYNYLDNRFALSLDLTPMDSNLGPVTVGITHDAHYNLVSLDATVSLLDDWCTVSTVAPHLELLESQYGLATRYVSEQTYFNYYK